MYKKLFVKSWLDLKSNLILFLPPLLKLLVNFILAILFLQFSGILNLLKTEVNLLEDVVFESILIPFFKERWLRIISSLIAFIVSSFFVGVGIDSIKYEMVNKLIKNKKVDFNRKDTKKYFWGIIGVKVIVFLLSFILFFILAFLTLLIGLISKQLAILFFILALVLVSLLFHISIFFRYPALVLKKMRSLNALKESFYFLKKKPKHVFFVWILISLVLLISWFIVNLITKFSSFLNSNVILLLLLFVIVLIINLSVELWSIIFLFRSYNNSL